MTCKDCGWPMEEDLEIASDARVLTPGLPIRQWRCRNGHAITDNPYLRVRTGTYRFQCDVCGQAGVSSVVNAKRHGACAAEHERRRRRKYLGSLTPAPEGLCSGAR